jgi:hypothetical protein
LTKWSIKTAAVRRRLPHLQPAAGSAVPGQQIERVSQNNNKYLKFINDCLHIIFIRTMNTNIIGTI